MKICTIIGTRPEIIRLSIILKKLDKISNHTIIHTGQNYNINLDKIFFKNFNLRKPDYYLNSKGSFGDQISNIISKLEKILTKIKPDKFFVLGDTNSSLGSIVASRLNIPVYHAEAGNRSYNDNSPEEINRKIIDHVSNVHLTYSYNSCQNLISEGVRRDKIFVVGNPIFEVMEKYKTNIENSKILKKNKLKKNNYFLITMHRQENVDDKKKLQFFIKTLNDLKLNYPNKEIVWPLHPRTKRNLKKFKILNQTKNLKIIEPLGFFDYVNLEKNCSLIFTDSGTVQEEASILMKPCIVLREKTERNETVENGSTIIAGTNIKSINRGVKFFNHNQIKNYAPETYLYKDVSSRIVNILLSNI